MTSIKVNKLAVIIEKVQNLILCRQLCDVWDCLAAQCLIVLDPYMYNSPDIVVNFMKVLPYYVYSMNRQEGFVAI